MKFPRRGPREVYRFYGEDEAPDVDEWFAGPEPEFEAETPTRELATESVPEPGDVPPRARRGAGAGQLRRVAVMTLLGAGVGLVAALALHSLRAPVGGERRGEGGVASLPAHSLSASAAPAPAEAPAQRTTPVVPRVWHAVSMASSSVAIHTAAAAHVAAAHATDATAAAHATAAHITAAAHATATAYTPAATPIPVAAPASGDEAPAQAQAPEFSFER